MPDLRFAVAGAEAVPFAATPRLALALRIENAPPDEAIHSIVLRCQVRIDPAARRYSAVEEERLLDLFGERARWGQTLRSLLWTHAAVLVPGFRGATTVSLPLECPLEMSQGPAKVLFALDEGEVPITLLFAGTAFHAGADGTLQVAPVPWTKEASFRLPVAVLAKVRELYDAGNALVPVSRALLDRLDRWRRERRLATWESALEGLLDGAAATSARGEAKEAA